MSRSLFLALALACLAPGASIHDVDFKNFSYPFLKSEFDSVPNHLRWMPTAATTNVTLRDGRYTFPCDESPCALITFDRVQFGNIAGLPGELAIATTVFHTGGTANWEYLYVIALRAGRPRTIAWLEAGSRADMGLRSASFDDGDLVLVLNDPDKRIGDCCSTGSITERYRWQRGAFLLVGTPEKKDDPTQ